MSRYIDADVLFEYILKEKAWEQSTAKMPRYDKGKYDAYYEMLKIIQEQPTVGDGWIPFVLEYEDEEKMDMLQDPLPEDEQEILVTNGNHVWEDVFLRDVGECYLDSGCSFVDNVTAWQPKPEPYKAVEK